MVQVPADFHKMVKVNNRMRISLISFFVIFKAAIANTPLFIPLSLQ